MIDNILTYTPSAPAPEERDYHAIHIQAGKHRLDRYIEIDGKRLQGVQHVAFTLGVEGHPVVTIELLPQLLSCTGVLSDILMERGVVLRPRPDPDDEPETRPTVVAPLPGDE